jgi:hypothetical protein
VLGFYCGSSVTPRLGQPNVTIPNYHQGALSATRIGNVTKSGLQNYDRFELMDLLLVCGLQFPPPKRDLWNTRNSLL